MNKVFRFIAMLATASIIIAACGPAAPEPAAIPTEEAAVTTEEPAAAEEAAATEAPAPTEEAPAATEEGAATEAPVVTEEAAAATAEESTSADAKILRVRLHADIVNMDPAFYPSSVDEMAANSILEGLVAYKPGEPGTVEVVNVLAESIEPSEDGLTIDFKLKEGVQFHGGYGELTAEDVKFSYERIANPETDSPYRGDWAALDHVEVTDKYTGQIILKEPFAPLWNSTLPLGSGWVLSKKAVEEMGLEAFATHPIGTGPYEFVEWTPNEKVVLKRFADYWGEALEWDEIHFIPIVEDSAAEIALETGELDFGRIAPGSVERFEADDRFEVIQVPTIDYTWLAMNVQHPNLEDINVRQAIRHAVDVPSILEAAYDGKWQRACALVAPGQVGHWADAPCYEHDVEKAKEFLAEAGLDTLDLTLTTDEAEESKAAAEVIQANLADIGINVEIIQQDAAAYYEGGFGEKGLKERQLTYVGFVNQPDPSWATVWFTCEQVDEWNWMYWCNEEYDKLHEAALKEQDPAKRAEMYIEMQQLWDEAAHTVWIGYDTLYYVVRSELEAGILPHGRFAAWSIHSK